MRRDSGGQQNLEQRCLWPPCEMPPGKRAGDQAGACREVLEEEGTLTYNNERQTVCGRALKLIVYMVEHQERINGIASTAGQLWMTWKGDGPHSIAGDIKAPL